MLPARLDAALVVEARGPAAGRAARAARRGGERRDRRLQQPRELVRVAGEHLGDPARVVEADEHVGDDEQALRQAGSVVGQRDRRLEFRDVVVADVTDHRRDRRGGFLERDEPVTAADERIAPQPAFLDGLEQEGAAAELPQVEVRPERCDEIGVDDGAGDHR